MRDQPKEAQLEAALDRAAARQTPADLGKLDRQFEAKLARLQAEEAAPARLLDDLRQLWDLLKAPEHLVAWKDRALVMAAIAYFVSPLDVVPDFAPLGYVDDLIVAGVVRRRLAAQIEAWRKARG